MNFTFADTCSNTENTESKPYEQIQLQRQLSIESTEKTWNNLEQV